MPVLYCGVSRRIFKFAVFILCCFAADRSLAQTPLKSDDFVKATDSLRHQLPIEKLYLQFDKPYYSAGDTIWFKAYLFQADYLLSSRKSGLLYIELADEGNNVVKRAMIPLADGQGTANIAINDDIPPGSYVFRAYTNWMRNFGDDYVFKRRVYVTSAGGNEHLITTAFKGFTNNGKDSLRAVIQFAGLDKQPVRLQDLQLRVMNGSHSLSRNKVSTDILGKIDVKIAAPETGKPNQLTFAAQEINQKKEPGQTLTIPVILNRPEKTDLQFMPEGGRMVAGLPVRIGFKAIGEDGLGADIGGEIYDSKGTLMGRFKSDYKGMGSFKFTPAANETYTAEVKLPNGATRKYPLPAVAASGTVLGVYSLNNDSLQVKIAASSDVAANRRSYYLVAQSRGVVCYTAHLTLTKNPGTLNIAKTTFPSGIAKFSLLDENMQPLNERVFFIDRDDNLRISFARAKHVYGIRDSVAMMAQVTDAAGNPVKGSFSIAVTDDGQVKSDSLSSNLLNNILLTSDLKGNIETPGYYLQKTPEARQALDNLLLTQGWVGYSWKQIFGPKPAPQFAAEAEFTVKGRVSNMFNKPVAGTKVVAYSKKPLTFRDTLTDLQGRFTFRDVISIDTPSILVQAVNKRGRSFNVGVDVDEFRAPVFAPDNYRQQPWYVNTDSLLISGMNTHIQQLKDLGVISTGGHVLREVNVTAKKAVKGSQNLNGPGESDQALDEKDLEKFNKETLYNILVQEVKGFKDMVVPPGSPVPKYLYLYQKPLHFVFDGIDVNGFFADPNAPIEEWKDPDHSHQFYLFIRGYLDYYTAEDIKGIEVMYNSRNNSKYYQQLVGGDKFGEDVPAFIEITTRGGGGPFLKKTAGVYLYKPLLMLLPKQFYSPKYAVKNPVTTTDLRSTIYWAPYVFTDANGCATISFYTADKRGTYSVIMEGSDMNGNIGSVRAEIVIR